MASISFSGLTGFDFGQIADALIELERIPVDTLTQQKEDLASKKSMYNEVSSTLNSLKTSLQALAKPNSLSFVKATSSNESKLGVAANSTAALGSYSVTVHRLATATRVTSGFATQLGISDTARTSKNLNDPVAKLGGGFTGGYVTINGTQVAINIDPDDPTKNSTNDTLQEVINRINSTVAGVTASYDAATDKLVLTSAGGITVGSPDDTSNFLSKTGLLNSPDVIDGSDHTRTSTRRLGRINAYSPLDQASLGTALSSSTGTFSINGVSIDYDASVDSLTDIVNRINSKVDSVTANYDSMTDKLILSSKQTGSLGITRSDTSGNFLAAMGLLDNSGESQAVVNAGQNAMITAPGLNDGQPIYSTSNTVTDAISGVTLTLKEADPDTPIEIGTSRDGGTLKTKIQDFVAKYNAAMDLISTRLTEEKIKDPASQTLRRVGMLRGDSMLSMTRANMSRAVIDVVESLPSDFNRLGNLGISLDTTNYKSGRLSFDESKFDDLIDENFEQAYDILFTDADGDGVMDDGETGAVPRLLAAIEKVIDTTTKDLNGNSTPIGDIPNRNYSIDRQIKTIDVRIEQLEQQLTLREASLRAKFLAAEQAISALSANANGVNSLGVA